MALIFHERPDTIHTPDSGTSTASRQTVVTGEAARQAAEQLAAELKSGRALADLEGREFYGECGPPTPPDRGQAGSGPGGQLPYAHGAKGVGELCLIPTSPAASRAYYRLDGKFRNRLPLQDTFYKKEKS